MAKFSYKLRARVQLRNSLWHIILSLVIVIFISENSFSQADTSLTFSEIMFIPQSGNNEFIELYNLSETDTVDLNNYRIYYHTSNPDFIISAGYGTKLPPRSFAIILEGDYDFQNGIYNNLIPPSALILKISDNAFGTTGMANTSDRTLWLVNPFGDTLDTYTYSANNATGFSDEKKIMSKDNSPSNWANSMVFNGTPGFRNSVTPLLFDLELSSLTFSPQIIFSGDDASINVVVKNRGLSAADSYTIQIFNDFDFDSVATPGELLFSQDFSDLMPGDSTIATTFMSSLSSGSYQIIARVLYSQDEDTTNNYRIRRFNVHDPGVQYNDIIINEIMYAPQSGEPEWIELFNKSVDTINIKKWTVADNASSAVVTLSDVFIAPGEYIVLSRDSSVFNFYHSISSQVVVFNLPVLNNTGDAVVVKDSLGVLIDSLTYTSSWGGSSGGRSLERISADEQSTIQQNWGTSISPFRATPGSINSLTPKEFDLRIKTFKTGSQFAISGEFFELVAEVENSGLSSSGLFDIQFYHDQNADSIPSPSELIGTLSGSSLLPGSIEMFSIPFQISEEGLNHFIVRIEWEADEDSTNNFGFTRINIVTVNEIRNDLVINEFMYAPTSPEPEWIEVFNRSDKQINLKNYRIADNRDTATVINTNIILNPGEYLVIAADSSIMNFHNITSQLVVKSFPVLNNTDDKIILIDSIGRVIDSLEYRSAWGGTSGRSLERIDPSGPSADSSNWRTTISRFRGTPGYINSVTQKDFDLILSSLVFNPPFPVFGDETEIYAKVNNAGRNNAVFKINLYEDTNLDSLPDLLLRTIEGQFIAAGDSIVISLNYITDALFTARGFYAEIIYAEDEDSSNNYLYRQVVPGYPEKSIIINEIMYAPLGGEPEWVELFNRTNQSINLKGWRISDVVTTPATAVINRDAVIPPAGYLLISRDSSVNNYHRNIPSEMIVLNLPNLNNDRDGVVLRDDRGQTIDSVFYFNLWGGTNGFSLERIDADAPSLLQANWGTSIDIEQSTPGRINSITPKEFDLLLAGIFFDPRFPVPGSNVFIRALLRNSGSAIADNFIVNFLFDHDNNNVPDMLLATFEGTGLLPGDSVLITSTVPLTNVTEDVLVAVNILFPNDEDTLNNYSERLLRPGYPERSIIINEVMYAPAGGEPEWIEFVNISEDTLNIRNWSLSDVLPSPSRSFITTENDLILPGEYFVVARDTSIFLFHPDLPSKVFISSFGTLGNTSDGVMIYDFRDAIIDSLMYNSSWGGRNGFSLERISTSKPTNDNTNWVTSLSSQRSTPGRINSIANVPSYERGAMIINEIMYDPGEGNNEFIEFINLSGQKVNIGGWRIRDEKDNFYRLSDTSFVLEEGSYFVLAADSTILNYPTNSNARISIINVSSLGLINAGELILLTDARGTVIDSVWYSSGWHNRNISLTKNRSLERINPLHNGNDPLNWSTSVGAFGATPGERNSIFSSNDETEAKISVSPNPFSPDNDGFEDFTMINYNLSQPTAQVRVKVYDSRGRLVRTLLNNSASGSRGSVIFDGRDDNGNTLRIGIYILFLEALNESSGVIESVKSTVVIARKLK